jgi:hypothetical protein
MFNRRDNSISKLNLTVKDRCFSIEDLADNFIADLTDEELEKIEGGNWFVDAAKWIYKNFTVSGPNLKDVREIQGDKGVVVKKKGTF